MRRTATSGRRSGCPISIALEVIGDSWSLLIIRDLMFKGRRTFNEFLNADEKIATNILSDRLAHLERHGIIEKRRDDEDARRFLYRLTKKGIDLAPVLVDLVVWSAQYQRTDAPPDTVEAMTHHRERFLSQVRRDWVKTS